MDKSGISHIARALRGEAPGAGSGLARGFHLGGWLARPDLCSLEKDGQSIQLEAKTMGVLLCLAQHAPHAVTREQFIAEVWNGRIVTDEVLSRAISLLRAVLEDDAHEPRFIRTIPRVGYALVAEVQRPEPSQAAAASATAAPEAEPAAGPATAWLRRPAIRWAFAAALALAAAALAWWASRDAAAPSSEVRLAVLPLTALGAGDGDYAAAGLTEELTVSLARARGLRVVARDSALRFPSGQADLQEVAHALGATHIVSGSVRAGDERMRVTVHLSEIESGTELWAQRYDRALGDLFVVQADIAAAVVRALAERLPAPAGTGGVVPPAAVARPPANPEAYRLFLQGRQQLARRGEEGTRAAIALFERSIAADRGFLRAHLALAWACALLVNATPGETAVALERADQALAEVARQSAMSGEVHAVRAWLEMERNDWGAAEAAFRTALAESPDDTELRLLYSQFLGATAQADAARREAETALASDPLSPAVNLRLAALSVWAGKDREAARYLETARELGLAPSAAPELPMLLMIRARRFDELERALAEVQRRRGQGSEWASVAIAAMRDPARGPEAVAALDRAAAAGQVERLLHLGALVLAHQPEAALRLLRSQTALRSRELEFVFSDDAAPLRRHPGFGEVVTQLRLDAYWDSAGWPPQCARSADAVRCR